MSSFFFYKNLIPLFFVLQIALASPQKIVDSSETKTDREPLPLLYFQVSDQKFKYVFPSNLNDVTDYACPEPELQKIAFQSEQESNLQCVFPDPKNISSCQYDVKPRLVQTTDSCANGEGMLYRFQYDICFKDKHEAMVVSNVAEREEFVSKLINYNISSSLGRYLIAELGQQLTGDTELQFLVPYMDIDPVYARNTIVNLYNLNFQRKRLHSRWDDVNYRVWEHLTDNELHESTTIYTTTSRFKWVKLLRSSDGKAIVIVLYDIIETYTLKDEDFLCPSSICRQHNWNKIEHDDEDNIRIHCCEATLEVVKKLKLTKEVNAITGIFTLPMANN